jgi:hypothetical protein
LFDDAEKEITKLVQSNNFGALVQTPFFKLAAITLDHPDYELKHATKLQTVRNQRRSQAAAARAQKNAAAAAAAVLKSPSSAGTTSRLAGAVVSSAVTISHATSAPSPTATASAVRYAHSKSSFSNFHLHLASNAIMTANDTAWKAMASDVPGTDTASPTHFPQTPAHCVSCPTGTWMNFRIATRVHSIPEGKELEVEDIKPMQHLAIPAFGNVNMQLPGTPSSTLEESEVDF